MATKQKTEPVMTELSVSFSAGCKGSLSENRFENGTAQITRSERWNVEGLTQEEIDSFYADRYEALRKEVNRLIEEEYVEITS